ncbi:hypothetical protein OL548_19950 [Lysinibacillus sp. MHQ-1]|nr:hypothetical protein OL548_19950 [Lysinibacillus sp. MHQ-1]
MSVLLISIFNFDGSKPLEVAAASAPIKDTITLTVKFPDTIGEGFGVEPTNPEEIHMMIDSQGAKSSLSYRMGRDSVYVCTYRY